MSVYASGTTPALTGTTYWLMQASTSGPAATTDEGVYVLCVDLVPDSNDMNVYVSETVNGSLGSPKYLIAAGVDQLRGGTEASLNNPWWQSPPLFLRAGWDFGMDDATDATARAWEIRRIDADTVAEL